MNLFQQNGHSRFKSLDISLESRVFSGNRSNRDDTGIISHCTTININQSQSQNITINGSPVLLKRKSSSYCDDKIATKDRHALTTNNEQLSLVASSSDEDDEVNKNDDSVEIDESNVNFNQNREQWQKRANTTQSHIKIIPPSSPPPSSSQTLSSLLKSSAISQNQGITNNNTSSTSSTDESSFQLLLMQRSNHTPDLVMDLPLVGLTTNTTSQNNNNNNNDNTVIVTENNFDLSLLSFDTGSSSSSSSTSCFRQLIESPTTTGPESPDMQTAAERFAKQNQCTLKKNTKLLHVDNNNKQQQQQVNEESNLIAITTSPMLDRKYVTIGSGSVSDNATTTTFKPQLKSKPPVLKKPAGLRKDQPDLSAT